MKKILTAILVLITVALFSTVAGLPSYASGVPDTTDARYQDNLKFMNMQVTDTKRLTLLLRPSSGIESDNEEIIALAKSLTASLTNDYSKAQAIHDWVCTNIYYDYDELNNPSKDIIRTGELTFQSAVTTLQTKKGLCEGYANLTCALLRAAGIPSQNYSGWAFNGESDGGPHGWSGAYISSQKRWIILDTTWDTYNRYSAGEYVAGSTNTYYFDIDLHDLSRTHVYDLYTPNKTDADFHFSGPEKVSIGLGAECQFNASCPMTEEGTPEDKERVSRIFAGVENESYMSSNPKVATVDQMGRVTTHAYGTTTISAALLDGSGLTASYVITVEPQKLSYFSLNGHIDSLLLGESCTTLVRSKGIDDDYPLNKKYLTWSTSNPKVLTVDSDGKVTAVGLGTAKITATYLENKVVSSAITTITVKPEMTGIKLSSKTLALTPGSNFDLSKKFKGIPEAYYPNSYGFLLNWTSSNPKVVTVGGCSGELTALKEGSATITVSLIDYREDGTEYTKFSDTCVVTVTKPRSVTKPIIKSYTVTFNSNGGTVVKPVTVKANSKLVKPANPTKNGFKFVDWYKDPKCTKVWDFEIDKVTANTTIYAGWKK